MLLTQDLTHLDVPAAPVGVDYPDPRWWLWQLEGELALRYPLVRLQQDYYEGRHRLSFATSKFREVFGEMLAAVSDNWMPTVVNASKERLRVQGFRFPDGTTSPTPRRSPLTVFRRAAAAGQGLDRHAWDIWQRNGLDVGSGMAFREAILHGEGYLLVWWDDDDDRRARITVEHPAQVVVRYAAGDPQRRAAALKKWQEDDGTLRATLYLPDRVHRYRRDEGATSWEQLPGAEGEFDNPLRVVPVIPLINDPHIMPVRPPYGLWITDDQEDAKGQAKGTPVSQYAHVGLGRSDIVDLISTQDSINKLVCDMLVASEVSAFRQRWATGLEIPEGDDGKPIAPFEAAIERMFTSPDPEARFGTFEATDLRNFTVGLEQRVQSLSSRSRTPPHYLLGMSGSFPSGESLKATETGLVSKVEDKHTWFGEPVEEAEGLALRIEGADVSSAHRVETAWKNPESRSESEFIDAQVKKLAIGVPPQQIWEDAGYSPQQIDRFRQMLIEYAAYTAVHDELNPAPALDPAAAAGGQHAGGGPQPAQ